MYLNRWMSYVMKNLWGSIDFSLVIALNAFIAQFIISCFTRDTGSHRICCEVLCASMMAESHWAWLFCFYVIVYLAGNSFAGWFLFHNKNYKTHRLYIYEVIRLLCSTFFVHQYTIYINLMSFEDIIILLIWSQVIVIHHNLIEDANWV